MATTEYETWQLDYTRNPQEYIACYLGEHAHEYYMPGVLTDFLAAVNDTLPQGVVLHGRIVIGPHINRPDYDLAEIVNEINLAAIAERHALDK